MESDLAAGAWGSSIMRFMLRLFCALALGACAQGGFSSTDTATMPLNAAGGPELNQNEAIALAGWALDDPANTAGKPGLAARAIAAEDWLSGQTMLYGNYGSYAPGNELSWSQFRQQVRAAIGVPPGASSQEVVNRLLAASDAIAAGQTAAAKAQLAAPVFTLGPDATLQALANLPPFSAKQWPFAELNRYAWPSGGGPGR
jgi:hypothetical protein